MDAARFDRLARSPRVGSTRRRLLRLAAVILGVGTAKHEPDLIAAKKNKNKRLRRNAFGCVDVGGKCRGNSANCCSGICQGKKPKRRKKDKSRCVAHDQTTCLSGQTEPGCGGTALVGCETTAGRGGICFTTTGNAGVCAADTHCSPCRKDADCIGVCGPQSACVPCAGCDILGTTTACVSPGPCVI
jgi:hypothetical protein